MRAAGYSADSARALVEARLGREPQDTLETAVVLEAWGGVPAREALAVSMDAMRVAPARARASVGRLPQTGRHERIAAEALAFVVVVVAVALWAGPLASQLSTQVVEDALRLALPITLALQWALRSRYLGRPNGLELLAGHRLGLAVATFGLADALAAAFGVAGVVAALLVVTWTAGTVLVRRGWAPLYAATVAAATGAMLAGVLPGVVLAAVAAATAAGCGAALRPVAVARGLPPGQWSRAATAGAVGCGIGLVIVADGALRWTGGAAPAIVLLPSTVASLWGGHHLWGFQREIARSLAGVSALDGVRGPAWRPLAVLAGAVGRFATGTAVLSGALVLARPALGLARVDVTLLAAFALLALATLLVSLLEAVGRGAWALGAVAAALGAETLAASSGGGGAGPLLAGGAAAVAVALPAAVALLMRPANTLATTLYVR